VYGIHRLFKNPVPVAGQGEEAPCVILQPGADDEVTPLQPTKQ